jgi:predicted CoA-substrate-specific enzyme activase
MRETDVSGADFVLGLDLGSRAGKAVLFDPAASRVAASAIIDSTPDQAADAEALVRLVLGKAGADRGRVKRIVATGYGRVRASVADESATEISCQAAGIASLHPEARTIVDIGGQDSKAIALADDGRVRDFAMNDRCAAGTGRFLEVAARILGTDVSGIAGLALGAASATAISSMCVVFAESEVIGMLARGLPPEEVAAGVHRAMARRVAALAERLGAVPPIVFTGGVALNPAMSAALGEELGQRLIVPADPRHTGALGAALVGARSLGFTERPSAGSAETDESGPEISARHEIPALARFDDMVEHAIAYAEKEKARGRKIVSMFCEYTPRELILAAGAVPVCACGGSHEMAESGERELPPNLCPLIKSSYGFALEKENPIFEMSDLVVAETTCDGKKKMFELLGETKPLHVLELPQKPDGEEGFALWKAELAKLLRRLEDLTGIAATPERLRDAIRLMNGERRLRRELARFAGRGLTGREILDAKSLISGIPEDMAAYEEIVSQAEAVGLRRVSRPAVLLTGVPAPHGAEKVVDIIEDAGAVVIAQENCTGLKPLFEDVAEEGDPLDAIARKYLHLPCSCMTPNDRRWKLLDDLIAEFDPDGVVELVWQACLTYDVESVRVRRHLERTRGLPYLKIVTDYSPSDSQQLKLRVEAFVTMIKERAEKGRT